MAHMFLLIFFSFANAVIVIVAAIRAANYIHYDVSELIITGGIRAGLPPFKR